MGAQAVAQDRDARSSSVRTGSPCQGTSAYEASRAACTSPSSTGSLSSSLLCARSPGVRPCQCRGCAGLVRRSQPRSEPSTLGRFQGALHLPQLHGEPESSLLCAGSKRSVPARAPAPSTGPVAVLRGSGTHFCMIGAFCAGLGSGHVGEQYWRVWAPATDHNPVQVWAVCVLGGCAEVWGVWHQLGLVQAFRPTQKHPAVKKGVQ